MRILFDLGMTSHIRHFDTVVPELAGRGHDVVTMASFKDGFGQALHPIVAFGNHRDHIAPSARVRTDGFGPRAYQNRCARDYIQYRMPGHENSGILRQRARNMLLAAYEGHPEPERGARLAALVDGLDGDGLASLDAALRTAEAAVPPDPAVIGSLRDLAPDAIVLTPLVFTQYGQIDLVKAARSLGIPTVFLAGSWDNLTTKGMIHVAPDHTLVWNDIQKDEAVRLHGLDPGTVHVTGAPRFDAFFARTPERDRASFLAGLGLAPDRRTLVYLGSSNLIAVGETTFVERWLAALRASDVPELAEANVVLRPHPKFSDGWEEAFADRPGIAVTTSPSMNDDPLLYHTLLYGDAVVAVNTSAELEAAVLGTPVFTVLDPDFALGQSGTRHFAYLTREGGGIARTADSLAEHVAQLGEELRTPMRRAEIDAFVERFVRPCGLGVPATTATVDAIERVLGGGGAEALHDQDWRARIYDTYHRDHVAPRKGEMTPERLAKQARTLDHQLGEFLPKDRSARLLDVGCGSGGLVHWLHERGYAQARGIDTSADVVRAAKRAGIRNVERLDLRDLAAQEGAAYDAIFMRDVLEHIPKDQALGALDAVRRLLKPGGRLVLQVPNGASPLVGRILYGDFTHETAFTPSSLSQVLLACGFRKPTFKPAESPRQRISLWHLASRPKARRLWARQMRAAAARRLVRALIEAETGQDGVIVSANMIASAVAPGERNAHGQGGGETAARAPADAKGKAGKGSPKKAKPEKAKRKKARPDKDKPNKDETEPAGAKRAPARA